MPTFYVTFAADKHEPYVPLEQMVKVIADTPLEAAQFALAKASGPEIGQAEIWARVVVGTNPANGNWPVVVIEAESAALAARDSSKQILHPSNQDVIAPDPSAR